MQFTMQLQCTLYWNIKGKYRRFKKERQDILIIIVIIFFLCISANTAAAHIHNFVLINTFAVKRWIDNLKFNVFV